MFFLVGTSAAIFEHHLQNVSYQIKSIKSNGLFQTTKVHINSTGRRTDRQTEKRQRDSADMVLMNTYISKELNISK